MMVYEDKISKLTQYIDNMTKIKNKAAVDDAYTRDHYRNEVFEMLDKLIDSRTKMPTFNDLAV